MRRIKKPVFFIVLAVIALFTVSVITGFYTMNGDLKKVWIKGVNDIRWGIDIRGGVDVTFSPPEGFDADEDQLDSAKEVITQRLISLGINDYEVYVDYTKDRIITRFPWKAGETNFDPEQAVKEIGETAMLTFREGYDTDEAGLPTGRTLETIILEGKDVQKASPMLDENGNYCVGLTLTSEGAAKFSDATARLVGDVISIWMDDTCISYPMVNAHITGGEATITGNFDAASVKSLADKINSGALPFKLVTSSFSTISPTLGMGARDAMVLSGLIAFGLIAIFMIIMYRLPGFVAVIALTGQVAGTLACVTGYFGFMDSATLTIPGIAGIILAIGIGVDANIITAERIKEELRAGKTLDGAIESGFKRAFIAILDGNLTMIIVAVILMGTFGPTDSVFATMMKPFLFMFGGATEGTIYSFGFTLLVGVILNFLMGVFASRLMVSSLSKFKAFRNPRLYGGVKNG